MYCLPAGDVEVIVVVEVIVGVVLVVDVVVPNFVFVLVQSQAIDNIRGQNQSNNSKEVIESIKFWPHNKRLRLDC